MSKELIEKINALGFKKKKIETDLVMPLNSLSGMLNGKRVIPVKWAKKLSDYVDSHNPNKKPIETSEQPKSVEHYEKGKIEVSVEPQTPQMPKGLSIDERIKWMEENGK